MRQAWSSYLPTFLQKKLKGSQNIREIVGNTSWLMFDRAIRMSIGLCVAVWLARYLGPARLGIYNYALALVALVGYMADLGLQGLVVREVVHDEDKKGEILGTTFALKLASGLLSAVLACVVVWILRPSDMLSRWLVALVSIQLPLRAFNSVDFWFQAQVKSKYTVLATGSAFILASLARIILIVVEAPLWTFALVVSIETFIGAFVLVVLYRTTGEWFTEWRVRTQRMRSLLRQSWPLILSGFGAIVYLKVDQIMIREMISEEEVGIYAVAAQLSEVWYFIPTAIATSAFPALLRGKKEGKDVYERRLQRLYDMLFLAALAVAVPTTFIAEPVITTLYGSEFRAAGPILSIHIWASLFVFMRAALSKWLIAEDLFIFSMVTHGLGALVNVIANLYLIPEHGGEGAAIATVISYAMASYLSTFAHRKTWEAGKMMTLAIASPVRILTTTFSSRSKARF